MFNALIDSLTSFVPRNFIFGSVVPVLIFGFINAALLYVHVVGFREFAKPQLTGGPLAITVPVLFVAVIVAGYMLGSISGFLREVLEGRHLWPEPVAKSFRRGRQRKRDRIERRLRTVLNNRAGIEQRIEGWKRLLKDAAEVGNAQQPGSVGYAAMPVAVEVRKLERLREQAELISMERLRAVVVAFAIALRAIGYVADAKIAKGYASLLEILDDAQRNWITEEFRANSERQTWLGTLTTAPTRMGNVADALWSYFDSRYDMDLNTMWSRLQPLVQKADDGAYRALIDAKTQLDFLVACSWLTAFTAAGWLIALGAFGVSYWTFFLIGVLGPALAYFFYALAVTNYLSYAELVRGIVDLHRFLLLRALGLPMPSGIQQERALWSAMRDVTTFGTADVEISYEPIAP